MRGVGVGPKPIARPNQATLEQLRTALASAPTVEVRTRYDHMPGDGGIFIVERVTERDVYCTSQSGHKTCRSLADYGLIPYESGQWNQTNWLEIIE